MNLCVQPSNGFRVPPVETEDSKPLMTVVPTAQTFFLFCLAKFTVSTTDWLTNNSSESILCLERSSTSTGLKPPKPICNVNSAKLIPLICNLFKRCFEKCNPAVGAATAPSFDA